MLLVHCCPRIAAVPNDAWLGSVKFKFAQYLRMASLVIDWRQEMVPCDDLHTGCGLEYTLTHS